MEDYNSRVEAIGKLLQLFKIERAIYLTVTILSLVVLLVCASVLVIGKQDQIPAIVGMFGASGGIGYTCGRLLKMWGDAMRVLGQIESK